MFSENGKESRASDAQSLSESKPNLQIHKEVDEIEKMNFDSWYVQYGEDIPFIAMSITDVGPSRDTGMKRTELAGNMSSSYGDKSLPEDERLQIEDKNVKNFLESLGIDPKDTVIIQPEQKYQGTLNVLCADDAEKDTNPNGTTRLQERADMVYTTNPNTILAIKPADCPIIITKAHSENLGDILCMTHIPWRGGEDGHVEKMMAWFEEENISPADMKIYISAGARKENYPFHLDKDKWEVMRHKDLLASDVINNPDGSVDFKMDTQGLIRAILNSFGVSNKQIFEDTSDTGRLDSGYSSHGRAMRSLGTKYPEVTTRSLLVASLSNDRFGIQGR